MHSRIITRLTWSIGIAAAAWLAGWVASGALRSLGVPSDAVVVLSTVAIAAVSFGGCRYAALRLDEPGAADLTPLLAGPAILALTSFLSDEPWWYRIVGTAGIVLASGLGLVAARANRAHPLDRLRGSQPWR